MSDKLKACPFCGMESEKALKHKTDCFFSFLNDGMFAEAFEHWNTRPIEDAQAAEITELRAELAAMECPEAEGDIGAEQQQSLYDELEAKNKEQAAEIERLRGALEIYGNHDNWDDWGDSGAHHSFITNHDDLRYFPWKPAQDALKGGA